MELKKAVSVLLIFIILFNILPVLFDTSGSQIDDNGVDMGGYYPFGDRYPSIEELYSWFEGLEDDHPDICKRIKYGESWEGRDLYVMKVSDDVDIDEDEPEILIDGGLHAREWSGPQVASYYLWRMVSDYESNDTIHWLVNNREIFVAPMLNPDGYRYDGDGMMAARKSWRKNRNDSTPSSYVGVDLNRNWDINWEEGDGNPASITYHGESPHSEYEIKSYTEWILSRDIQSYQNLHSYAGVLLIPWCHSGSHSPHDEWYRAMAEDMTSLTSKMGDPDRHYTYGQAEETIGYSAPGGANDWVYAETGAHGLCYEIYTGRHGFYPPEGDIMEINDDLDDSLIYQTRVADIDLGNGTGENGVQKHPPEPYILFGNVEDVDDSPADGENITLKNNDTGEILSIEIDENGYYEFNLGKFIEEGYDEDDSFILKVKDKEVEITIGDEWGRRKDIKVGDDNPPNIFDLTSDMADTGENFTFIYSLDDRSEIVDAEINYSFDDDRRSSVKLYRNEDDLFEHQIWVPKNAEELSYFITVRDKAGNVKRSETKWLDVKDTISPTAEAGEDLTVPINERFTLDSDGSKDNIAVSSYEWSIGDEKIEGRIINYTFSEIGNYKFILEVSDMEGNTGNDSVEVNVVDDERPDASAGGDRKVELGQVIELSGGNSTDNGNIVNYTWEIIVEDQKFYGSEISVRFDEPGVYDMKLTVRDSKGLSDYDYSVIEVVDDAKPDPVIRSKVNGTVGESILFDARGSSDNHKIKKYSWNFGDGLPYYGEKVEHTFDEKGTYTVELTVVDESGNEDTTSVQVEIDEKNIQEDTSTPGFTFLYLLIGISLVLLIKCRHRRR